MVALFLMVGMGLVAKVSIHLAIVSSKDKRPSATKDSMMEAVNDLVTLYTRADKVSDQGMAVVTP